MSCRSGVPEPDTCPEFSSVGLTVATKHGFEIVW
jgi:hypothetical protein